MALLIELQQTYKDQRTDLEWTQLLLDLMRLDGQTETAHQRQVVHPFLSIAAIPLAKPALEVICHTGPEPYEELRRASLVVASRARAQLLPMVATSVFRSLSEEQIHIGEYLLIEAYTKWLAGGTIAEREAGGIVNELAVLLLKRHRLLDAAQLLIRYGWLSFNLGHAPRLAQLTQKVMHQFDWYATDEYECGGLLLHYQLSPFLGKISDEKQRFADYQRIYEAVLIGKVLLEPLTESHVTNDIMLFLMNETRFVEAQAVLEVYSKRLEAFQASDIDLQASLLEKRAWFSAKWSEYVKEQGELQIAQVLREQAIICYRRCSTLLSSHRELSPLKDSCIKKRLARSLNNLSYHLSQIGEYEEALQVVELGITLIPFA